MPQILICVTSQDWIFLPDCAFLFLEHGHFSAVGHDLHPYERMIKLVDWLLTGSQPYSTALWLAPHFLLDFLLRQSRWQRQAVF